MKQIPWKEIREKYESGRISKEVLAGEYGISVRAIRYHIQKEDWVMKPYLQGTAEDCVFSTVRQLARQLERAESGEEVSVGEIKELTSVLKDLVKVKESLEESEGGTGSVRVEMNEEISAWSK